MCVGVSTQSQASLKPDLEKVYSVIEAHEMVCRSSEFRSNFDSATNKREDVWRIWRNIVENGFQHKAALLFPSGF